MRCLVKDKTKRLRFKYTKVQDSYDSHCWSNKAFSLCIDTLKIFFEAKNKAFTLIVSTLKPRGNNYYKIVNGGSLWYFCEDTEKVAIQSASTPWPCEADDWASTAFPNSEVLYIWIEQ